MMLVTDSVLRCCKVVTVLLIVNVGIGGAMVLQQSRIIEAIEGQTRMMKEQTVDDQGIAMPQGEDGIDERKSQQVMTERVKVTAYTASKRETDQDPGKTAIMVTPVPGLSCAVSRDLAHWLGGRVWIEGVGVRRVDDLMNGRYRKRVDVLVGKPKEAFELTANDRQVVFLGKG